MRRPIIAGNWKMHFGLDEAVRLAEGIAEATRDIVDVDIVVSPSFVSLAAVSAALDGTDVAVAAQTMHEVASGAYTGEVSFSMLQDIGCSYVILGHSERRQHFGETDERVNVKIRVALDNGLTPIICVGESLAEREQDRTIEKVGFQIRAALAGVEASELSRLVLAYEPIWAIGTGETASPEQAQQVHEQIRSILAHIYGEEVAQKVRIQYGGSVKPQNISELIAQPDIDGALVGGASLKADSFASIVEASASSMRQG